MSESLRVLVFLASALLWAAVGVAWATEAGFLARLRWSWQACPPLRRGLAALAVAVAVAYAGTKPEGTAGVDGVSTNRHGSERGVGVSTNRHESARMGEVGEGAGGEGASSKEQVVSADGSSLVVAVDGTRQDVDHNIYSLLLPPSSLNPAPCSLTDEDISRGYRLVSVVTNEAHSYEMPPDARLVGTWHLTDAYDAVAKVFLEGVSSKEQVVSADGSSFAVAADGTQQDVAHHTYSLLPTPYSFPIGGQVVTSLWAHVWGKARPQLGNASNELVAVGAPMFARRGVSRLWTAATTNGSVLLTWQNFFFKVVRRKEDGARGEGDRREGVSSKEKGVSAEGKGVRRKEQGVSAEFSSSAVAVDGTQLDVDHHTYSLLLPPFSLISAQLELFRDGSFVAWSNSVARVYRRVNPDDWDGDGIPNAEDDDPRVAADEPRFGPRQSLPSGAHTNNYCWIDLAVRDADALVSFSGDAPSNLPDPSFVARAGETNRVTLLIGKCYAVSCLLPVSVVGKSSDAVEVRQGSGGTLRLRWPVAIGMREGAEGEGVSSKEEVVSAEFSSSVVAVGGTQQDVALHTYSLLPTPCYLNTYSLLPTPCSLSHPSFTMVLTPPWLVGSFAWTNGCCRVSGDGPVFSLACGGGCACGGCAGAGFFAYEGYRLPARGGSCPCNGSGAVVPGEIGGEEPGPMPGASARFSRRVILFEDEYEDAPGVSVPWRSTETELACSASGGPNGGRVRIEARGADGLVPYGGLPLPFERELGPFESVVFKNTYRAVRPSGGEGDIVVTATFEENGTGATWTSEDRATAVRVEFDVVAEAPENKCRRRRRLGVRERVNCSQTPLVPGVEWRACDGGSIKGRQYQCPLQAVAKPLVANCGGVEYDPAFVVVEPAGIEVRDVMAVTFGIPVGHAGGVGMTFELFLLPLDVSFSEISVEEIPCEKGERTGYFDRVEFLSLQSHSVENGAGRWMNVREVDNGFGRDAATIESEIPRVKPNGDFTSELNYGWTDGSVLWDIPSGWGEKDSVQGDAPCSEIQWRVTSLMTIQSTGRSGVRKFHHQVTRDIDGTVYLDGARMK